MSTDFHIYCKKKPDADRLCTLVNARYNGQRCNRIRLRWVPMKDQNIDIAIDIGSSHYQRTFDLEDMDAYLAQAQEKGYNIPKEFMDKIHTDGVLRAAATRVRDNIDYDPFFNVVVDDKLCKLISRFPHLPVALPDLAKEWKIAEFSEGAELYKVSFSVAFDSSVQQLKKAADLAIYLTKEYDGILYDPNKEQFGEPDIQNIKESADRVSKAVMDGLESNLDRFLPKEIPQTSEEDKE